MMPTPRMTVLVLVFELVLAALELSLELMLTLAMAARGTEGYPGPLSQSARSLPSL